jgi:hypothetical protein
MDEVNSDGIERAFYHYVRLKVFNDKARNKRPHRHSVRQRYIRSSLAGRTIKADGTIVELKKEAITERDLVRARGLRRE